LSTATNSALPACTMASALFIVCVVCDPASTGFRNAPLAGTTGPWPDTCSGGPRRTPWLTLYAGAEALSVRTSSDTHFVTIFSFKLKLSSIIENKQHHSKRPSGSALGELAIL